MPDHRTGDRAERAAGDGALLGIGPGAHAAGPESTQGERRKKKDWLIHDV
jgi:hypothetical protein